MSHVFYLLAYTVCGMLIVKGVWQFVRLRLLISRCTKKASGIILDTATRKSLLSWPEMSYYYPIFQFDDENGNSQVFASGYAAQYPEQIVQGKEYTIHYDPRKPSRFYSPEWDGPSKITILAQIAFGILILSLTLYTAFKG